MNVQAIRGVCIGVGQHLAPGEAADIDTGTARFLIAIGAVQEAPADKLPPEPVTPAAKPAKKEP